jgi:hypothetical protein
VVRCHWGHARRASQLVACVQRGAKDQRCSALLAGGGEGGDDTAGIRQAGPIEMPATVQTKAHWTASNPGARPWSSEYRKGIKKKKKKKKRPKMSKGNK